MNHQPHQTEEAVTKAIEQYSDMVRRICFLYLRNPADVEDVFQEVFLKFFLNIESLQTEAHRKAWLCRVTFNQCKDLCKSFWRKKVVSLEGLEIPGAGPEEEVLTKAVLELPSDDKELIYLHYYEGRSVPEIAEIMEKNVNTVYTELRRAKERLRKKAGTFQ